MNKKIVMWAAAAVLFSGPALNLMAQEGPGSGPGGDEDEVGMSGMPEGGPDMRGGQGGEPGMKGGHGMKGEMGEQDRMMKKKMMHEGREGGGPGFMPEKDVLAIITKYDPAFAKKVQDLREIAPAKYKMLLQMSGKQFGMAKMEQDESIEKDAVRALSLEFDTQELARSYDKASDADKKTIKDNLKVKLAGLFDLKTRGQELRVRHMEKEIAKLKKNLESRKVSKDKIVQQRLEQMTGESSGW